MTQREPRCTKTESEGSMEATVIKEEEKLRAVLSELTGRTDVGTAVPEFLKKVIEKASSLRESFDTVESSSLIAMACRKSLQELLVSSLEDVSRLLAAADKEPGRNDRATTILCVSLAATAERIDKNERLLEADLREEFDTKVSRILASTGKASDVVHVSSVSTNSVGVELFTGASDLKVQASDDSKDYLPISVFVEPVLYISENDTEFERRDYSPCTAKVEFASHKSLGYTSRTGIIGEATIRVKISQKSRGFKRMDSWEDVGDSNAERPKLEIMEIRYLQRNSHRRKTQRVVDMYESSIFGESGFNVTMNCRTMTTSDEQAPYMHVQVVLRPPLLPAPDAS